jgi:hypothetical protein
MTAHNQEVLKEKLIPLKADLQKTESLLATATKKQENIYNSKSV